MACMCGGCEQCTHDMGFIAGRALHDAPACDCGQPLDGGAGGLCTDCVREAHEHGADCADARLSAEDDFDAYVERAREELAADQTRADWIIRRVIDRGEHTMYRYRVVGVNLSARDPRDREIDWEVPSLWHRYDLTHAAKEVP